MMVLLGYGVIKMAWGTSRSCFGTCGNFKYEFHDLTDVKATRSVMKPNYCRFPAFISSVNTTDGTDLFKAQFLNWTGTTDSTTAGELVDASEVFDGFMNGAIAENTTDKVQGIIQRKDDDELYTWAVRGNDGSVADTDAFPTGKAYIIRHDRMIQTIAQDANDDGYLIVLG